MTAQTFMTGLGALIAAAAILAVFAHFTASGRD